MMWKTEALHHTLLFAIKGIKLHMHRLWEQWGFVILLPIFAHAVTCKRTLQHIAPPFLLTLPHGRKKRTASKAFCECWEKSICFILFTNKWIYKNRPPTFCLKCFFYPNTDHITMTSSPLPYCYQIFQLYESPVDAHECGYLSACALIDAGMCACTCMFGHTAYQCVRP